MTTQAWIMLGITWAVILYFTGKFFWMVLKTPPRPEEPDHDTEGILRKAA